MYELSQAAAEDIEALLDRSIIDFGPIQTDLARHVLGIEAEAIELLETQHQRVGRNALAVPPFRCVDDRWNQRRYATVSKSVDTPWWFAAAASPVSKVTRRVPKRRHTARCNASPARSAIAL